MPAAIPIAKPVLGKQLRHFVLSLLTEQVAQELAQVEELLAVQAPGRIYAAVKDLP